MVKSIPEDESSRTSIETHSFPNAAAWLQSFKQLRMAQTTIA
jgi:hypothetical protein